MRTKIQVFKSGALAMMERESCGLYRVIARDASGTLLDKVRCDDYRDALDYYASFKKIARGAK